MNLLLKANEDKSRSVTPRDRMKTIRYERNENGEVQFIFIIDLSEFLPDEINIIQTGYHVTIDALRLDGLRRARKEHHEVVILPKNTDMHKELQALFNENGHLVVKIMIIPRFFSSTTYRNYRTGYGPSPLLSEDKTVYLEQIVMDPEFKDADIQVNVEGNTAIIVATIEYKNEDGDMILKEFSEECRLPSNINAEDIKAEFSEGVLTLSTVCKSLDSKYGSLQSNKTELSSVSDVFQW